MNPRLESKYRRELRTLKARKKRALIKRWQSVNKAILKLSSNIRDASRSISITAKQIASNLSFINNPCPYMYKFGSSNCGAHICSDSQIDACEKHTLRSAHYGR